MLGGRSALASVFLCFVCLLGPTPPAAGICTTDLPKQVKSMIRIAPQLNHLGCRLYTQTATDFQNCAVSSLRCFSAEMKVLIEEWNLAKMHVRIPRNGLVKGLQRLADRFSLVQNVTTSECRRCELLQQKDAEEFLGELEGTLEKINSGPCPPEDL
ncbi:interleukin 15, like isoform X2 [Pungitius pungitius]|uniref:interleukin 15, like isoform X2 n=1 Tax=Pungitius pungitius TaxID=134920 RepID=UPI002E0DB1FB